MTPARNLDFEFQLPEHTKYRTIKEVEENLNAFQNVSSISEKQMLNICGINET